ncbi:hypothetical protein [Acidisphaera sp. S103]|uniref:hypothetical protein n=1 Tax=Acidisphaera sp. S103 TaxID=1747223 RepID=UPI00131E8711|nr:hypothetical protein [Acidisphaera sp. S103]
MAPKPDYLITEYRVVTVEPVTLIAPPAPKSQSRGEWGAYFAFLFCLSLIAMMIGGIVACFEFYPVQSIIVTVAGISVIAWLVVRARARKASKS